MPVEFRELTLLRNWVRRHLLPSPELEEHPPHHFAFVNPTATTGEQFSHGCLDFLGRGGQTQRLQGFDQFGLFFADRMVILARLGLGWLSRRFRLNSTGSPLWPMPRLPNFQTLLLQIRVENRTLAGLMSDGLWKDSGLNQGVEPRLRQPQHLGHRHDGNNCLSGLFLDGHRTVSGLFVNAKRTIEGRKLDSSRMVPGLFQDCFRMQRGPKQDGKWAVSAPNWDRSWSVEAPPGMLWRSRVRGGPGTGSFFRNDPSSADSR